MPTASDELYETSTILEATANIPSSPSFLKQRLFAIDETTTSDTVAVDSYRGIAKLAPFVAKRKRGIAVPRSPFQTNTYSPPRIAPTRDLRADDLYLRTPGDPVFAKKSGAEREAYWLVQDWAELDAMISRRIEWMISQLLFSGKIVATDADDKLTIEEIDYGAPESIVPAALWTDATNANPPADLKAAQRHLTSVAGATANLVVFGSQAADLWEGSDKVKDAYSRFWIKPGVLEPKEEELGVFSIGDWRGLPLLSYEAVYVDDNGTEQPMIPKDKVLIASTAIKHKVAYAAVAQVDPSSKRMDTFEGVRVPQVTYCEETDTRLFRLTSRPLPVPADMLAWVIMDVA